MKGGEHEWRNQASTIGNTGGEADVLRERFECQLCCINVEKVVGVGNCDVVWRRFNFCVEEVEVGKGSAVCISGDGALSDESSEEFVAAWTVAIPFDGDS